VPNFVKINQEFIMHSPAAGEVSTRQSILKGSRKSGAILDKFMCGNLPLWQFAALATLKA